MSCWLTGVNFGIYYVNEVRRPAQSVRNEDSTVGPSGRNESNELLPNHEVGPREWLVYSRRGKRVSQT
jgi:hypothetical protein